MKRAFVMAAIINYFDRIMVGSITAGDIGKIIFTFTVPYVVSTISSVLAINEAESADS